MNDGNLRECAGFAKPGEATIGAGSVDAAGIADRQGAIWCVFADAISFPEATLVKSIREGVIVERLRALATANYASAGAETDWLALQDTGKREDDLAAEYTRLFDRAARGECTLYGSAQLGPQMKIMEEIVRFYDHFGVAVADDAVETPDHLTVELEFIHCLAYGEAETGARGEDSSPYARARRDFIARHPGRLVSSVRRHLADLKPMPYYAALFRLLDQCLQIDLERLSAQYGPASLEATGGCST